MAKIIKTEVPIEEIHFDSELYPRTQTSWQTAFVYSQEMEAGAQFPPVVLALFEGKKYLVDGKHRIEAHKLLKKKTIQAIVHIGWNKKKIFEESIRTNVTHGLALSAYEKRRLALKLRAMKYGDQEISTLIQVPLGKLENFVGQRLVNSLTGNIIVKSPLKHMAGQTVGEVQKETINTSQSHLSSRSQIGMLSQLISIIENNLLDTSDGEVLELIDKLKNLINKI